MTKNINSATVGSDYFFIFEKAHEVDFVKVNIQLDKNNKIVSTGMKPSTLDEMAAFLTD